MSDPPKSIRKLLIPDAPDDESEESNPASEMTDHGPADLEHIRHFFDEVEFDPYEKSNLRPDSYRTAGEPCHGGYAHEIMKPDSEAEEPKD